MLQSNFHCPVDNFTLTGFMTLLCNLYPRYLFRYRSSGLRGIHFAYRFRQISIERVCALNFDSFEAVFLQNILELALISSTPFFAGSPSFKTERLNSKLSKAGIRSAMSISFENLAKFPDAPLLLFVINQVGFRPLPPVQILLFFPSSFAIGSSGILLLFKSCSSDIPG